MASLRISARRFCEGYPKRKAELDRAAEVAERFVREALSLTNIDIHLITARAKSFRSALAKIRSKHYGAPSRQMTDVIGVRVITYYQDDVDRVAGILQSLFEIDPRNSVDKRQHLNIQEFGYRSVHLIARLSTSQRTHPGADALGVRWFEIQVRSVLEHAWAEIEHEVRYRAGIKYPRAFNRSFAALAGALEVVEGQFLNLKAERRKLVTDYRLSYLRGGDPDQPLDAARLLGLLEARRPHGMSWVKAEEGGTPFAPRIEAVCVEALNAAGIGTAADLDAVMQTSVFRDAVSRFASLNSLDPNEVSHFAISVIAVGCTSPDLLLGQYPELADDGTINELFSKPGTAGAG